MAIFSRKKSPAPSITPPRAPAVHSTPNGEADSVDGGESVPFADSTIEQNIRQIGSQLLTAARQNKSGLLSKAFWSDKLMEWSMKDDAFKVQFFRFVDAFPMLKTSEAIHEH